LQKLLRKLFPWQIQWKGILLESLLFLAAYIVWVIFRPPQSPSRSLVGSLAVLVPAVAAVILVFWSLPQLPSFSRPAWRFLGLGLACWSVGAAVRTFYEGVRGIPAPTFSVADIFNLFAYPLLFSALILYPFENRYAPSRFRFLLDAAISAGVVATLGWLILARPAPFSRPGNLVPLVYPIADLILLMILVNMLLANRKARRALFLWGIGLLFFLLSDYIYSLLAPLNGYQVGGPESLGWTMGGLIFGCGAVFVAKIPVQQSRERSTAFDLGTRLQNILPITLVLALLWFVLADWRLNGRLSLFGLGTSLFLTLALIVRMGVHAGEIELHQYWQLFSSIAEPTFICDGRGKILLGNPALARALGLREGDQGTGQPLAAIFDGQTLSADLLRRAARQECSLEVSLRSQRTPYLLSLSPIFSESRKVLLAGAAHDLSDQKRQQEAIQRAFDELQMVHQRLEELNAGLEQKVEERTHTLNEAYRQLEEQNKILQALDQLKSDFVSMVSHELRTPLTSLNGGLELLLNQKSRPASDRTTLKLMKDEVQRLTRFVENILNLSAMEAGRINLHPLPLSLAALLEDIRRQFSAVPGAQRIRVHLPPDLPRLLADEMALRSIFHHLLDNALKYASEGPVVVDAVRERSKVRVRVTDSGVGIPEEKRSLLFQRFQRLDARDSQSVYGYGLGLYFSQRMLRAMRSDLVFEAPPEGGARFYFYLKVAR
jgi:PAS domain S-box-containing protein